MQISMREFIASGNLGPISLGASREEVEAALGPPHQNSKARRRGSDAIWKYGGVEIYFDSTSAVEMIFCDDFNSPCHWIDLWILRDGLLIAEAGRELRAAEMEFSRSEAPSLPDQIYLVAQSGVHLEFAPNDSGVLQLMSFWQRL